MQLARGARRGLGLYRRRVGGPRLVGRRRRDRRRRRDVPARDRRRSRARPRAGSPGPSGSGSPSACSISPTCSRPARASPTRRRCSARCSEIRDGNIEQTVDALTAARDQAPPRRGSRSTSASRCSTSPRTAGTRRSRTPRRTCSRTCSRWWRPTWRPPWRPARRRRSAAPRARHRTAGVGRAARRVRLHGRSRTGRAHAGAARGRLRRAARMPRSGCTARRLIFLALAGRVAAVEALVAPRTSRHMSRGARTYWLAVAHERKGDAPRRRGRVRRRRASRRAAGRAS